MIQVKEFVDTDTSFAEKNANAFLAGLKEEQFISICYGSIRKSTKTGSDTQRSAILITYRTTNDTQEG